MTDKTSATTISDETQAASSRAPGSIDGSTVRSLQIGAAASRPEADVTAGGAIDFGHQPHVSEQNIFGDSTGLDRTHSPGSSAIGGAPTEVSDFRSLLDAVKNQASSSGLTACQDLFNGIGAGQATSDAGLSNGSNFSDVAEEIGDLLHAADVSSQKIADLQQLLSQDNNSGNGSTGRSGCGSITGTIGNGSIGSSSGCGSITGTIGNGSIGNSSSGCGAITGTIGNGSIASNPGIPGAQVFSNLQEQPWKSNTNDSEIGGSGNVQGMTVTPGQTMEYTSQVGAYGDTLASVDEQISPNAKNFQLNYELDPSSQTYKNVQCLEADMVVTTNDGQHAVIGSQFNLSENAPAGMCWFQTWNTASHQWENAALVPKPTEDQMNDVSMTAQLNGNGTYTYTALNYDGKSYALQNNTFNMESSNWTKNEVVVQLQEDANANGGPLDVTYGNVSLEAG